MPSSGTVTYSVNETKVIEMAFSAASIYGKDQTIDAVDYDLARDKLNMLVKQLMGSTDYGPGLKMWSRKRAYVFLQKDQGAYSLGPSGDHASASYVSTTLSTAEATSSTSIGLTSSTGMSASDNIGIVLDDGYIHWTTISGAPGSTTTIATGLASAASSGNRVFVYTTKMRRPLELLTCSLRDTNGLDVPVDLDMSLSEYESIGTKSSDGTPTSLYFEPQLTNATIYLDREPSDVTKVLRLVYLSPIEDFSAVTDTVDYPQSYYRFLVAQLAADLLPDFGKKMTDELAGMLKGAMTIARNTNPETSNDYFMPGAE